PGGPASRKQVPSDARAEDEPREDCWRSPREDRIIAAASALRAEERGVMAVCFGKVRIVLGVVLVVLGLLWIFGARLGVGRLPGDIVVKGEQTTFYFPIVTCIVLSVLLSLVLWLVQALLGRQGDKETRRYGDKETE